MSEVRVEKTKEGVLLTGDMPPQISSSKSLEIFPLRDGAYLVTVKGFLESAAKQASAAPKPGIAPEEAALIRKLAAIRFEARAPSLVERALSQQEKKLLLQLQEKRLVSLFHSGKYGKEGVYSISDDVYNATREGHSQQQGRGEGQQKPAQISPAEAKLATEGFMVVESEGDARQLSALLAERMKAGEIIGIRAFDRKFYIVSREFLGKWEKKALAAISKESKTSEEIAEAIGMPLEGCRALMLHLCEQGDTLEKAKGKFAKA